jgi:hypothetical protein
MHKLFYKIQLHGQWNLGNGGRNGKTLALKMGCGFENLRALYPQKPGLSLDCKL